MTEEELEFLTDTDTLLNMLPEHRPLRITIIDRSS